ncbi:poly depolymerase [Periconia macrospinosa]|uniref:feruloyl esterase n=1 Tax=Periconia macrospinosa TaxID=97972 RepID=A0A2V1EAL0_9PLEO|nr:poly depolymerase [Periconia macrospinosa]
MRLLAPKTVTAFLSFTTLATAITTQPSSGCAKTSLPDDVKLGKSKAVNITSTSVNDTNSIRKYRIYVPNSYKNGVPVPLILSFHGRTQTAKYQEDLSQFSNETFGFEGISVYPQGLAPDGTTQWQGDPDQPSSINDIHFTLEILDYLTSNYCIDENAIYASGKSNGGGFTGVLACSPKASQKFAAFAAVSGAYYLDPETGELPPCKPALNGERKAIPFMELHGLKDKTIKYHGGLNTRKNANSTDIPTYVNDWAKRDGFDPAANVTGTLCGGDMLVTTHKWGETVQHYAYSNMEHDWMSEFGNEDSRENLTCKEADATRVILNWFKGWRLTGRAE